MTYSEEEHLLIDMLIGTRNSLEYARNNTKAAQEVQRNLERQLAEVEQAIVDYAESCGLIEFSNGSTTIRIRETHSVDIDNETAVPDEFMRITIDKKPDKNLIKKMMPNANWYRIRTNKIVSAKMKNDLTYDECEQ